MKIMLEIPDQTQAPQPATKSVPDTPAPAMSPDLPEAKSPKAVAEKRDAVPQANRVEKQKSSQPVAEKASVEELRPALGNSSLASFGGVNDIRDPDRANPNVFRFVAPKAEA
jgi:hypothetical protein